MSLSPSAGGENEQGLDLSFTDSTNIRNLRKYQTNARISKVPDKC